MCSDWAERHWKNSNGYVDLNKPSDRYDWCGLNLPEYEADIKKIETGKARDPYVVKDFKRKFISAPSKVFKNVNEFLNADGIRPYRLREANIPIRVISR